MSSKHNTITLAEAQSIIDYITALAQTILIPQAVLEVRDKAVLYCLRFKDKTLYIGCTGNPIQRYKRHRARQKPHTFNILRTGTLAQMQMLEQRVIRAAQNTHVLVNAKLYPGQKPTRPHSEGVAARVRALHARNALDVSADVIKYRMAKGETFEQAIVPRPKYRPPKKHVLTFEGKRVGALELSRRFNISYQTLLNRVHHQKLTVEQALNPVNSKNGKKLLPPGRRSRHPCPTVQRYARHNPTPPKIP